MKEICMSNYLLVLLLLFAGLLPSVGKAAETAREKTEREAAENKMTRMEEKLKQQDVAIRFYGKVQDQVGQPVEGAEVVLHVTRFSPNMEKLFGETKEVRVKTDSQGRFTVSQEKGRSLYIKEIQREGYDFSPKQNPVGEYRYAGESKTFMPDQANPVVFRMRKTGTTVFLLRDQSLDFQFRVTESGKAIGYDFVQRGRIKDVARRVGDDAERICDLQVKATVNTNDDTWAVVLSPGNTNGGIIVSEQLLYEAPDIGYQPEYTFTPEDRKPVMAKYVYLKNRDPAIYTRLEIEHVNANKEFFRLSGKSVTNPYGDRNLEQATDLPYEVTKQLADDAKASFCHNKRPVQPDLPKLVKEAEEKAVKDKGKQ
jgi:hypothetical protein